LRRVKIQRKRAPAGRAALAFLITAMIVFLAVYAFYGEEEAQEKEEVRITREITLSGGEGHIVHLGLYENDTDARLACARYMNRGAAGYPMVKDGKYMAAGNLYERGEDAEEMTALLTERGINCGRYVISAPDVRLRLTGTEENIGTIQKRYEAYLRTEKELLKLSEDLDEGRVSLSKANVLISVIRYDAYLSEKGTEKLQKENKVLSDMLSMFDKGFGALDFIDEKTDGEMLLSARIKYAAIEMQLARFDFLNAL